MEDDNEELNSYKEPCPQCSEVNWGISDEGKFFCQSCHTIIQKTKYIETSHTFDNSKVDNVSRGLRKPKKEWCWEWYVCEGFQFILLKQAAALEVLGICSDIKDDVMCKLWRLYLEKSKQAYCTRPLSPKRMLVTGSSGASDPDSDSACTRSTDFTSQSESSIGLPSSGEEAFVSDVEAAITAQSGSRDASLHIKKKTWDRKLSMPMTLAFCYLSLLWVRASVTLSDLLRLVFYRHIPYYNSQQYFPEKTKLYGPDIHIFEVQDFPVHHKILKMAQDLGVFLKLPRFPPITETCYYHPNVLSMKYLMEVNLPDELHEWTCYVAKKAKLDEDTVLTYDPGFKKGRMIPYDIHAVAIIVVVLKLIFALDDEFEWELAKFAQRKNQEESGITIFDFQKWYMTMKPCMDEACMKLEEEQARFSWESERILSYTRRSRARLVKRKRMVNNLKSQFSKLAGAAPDAGNRGPSSFLFNWEEQNTGKICFHGHSLEGIAEKAKKPLSSPRKTYWLNTVKKCRNHYCDHWKQYDESQFPSSYRFVLSLFSLVLRVEPSVIHYEVSLVEEKLFREIPTRKPVKKSKKKSL